VAKQRGALVEKGGDKDIGPAAATEVAGLDAHAAHGVAAPLGGGAGEETRRLKFATAEVVIVVIRHFVIADKDVLLAVLIKIDNDNSQSFAVYFQPAGFALVRHARLADIGEGAVAVSPEQPARLPHEL